MDRFAELKYIFIFFKSCAYRNVDGIIQIESHIFMDYLALERYIRKTFFIGICEDFSELEGRKAEHFTRLLSP